MLNVYLGGILLVLGMAALMGSPVLGGNPHHHALQWLFQ